MNQSKKRRLVQAPDVSRIKMPSLDVDGAVDKLTEGIAHGWAINRRSSAPVKVELVIDGVKCGQTIANAFRQDLLAAQIGNGFHVYNLPIPETFLDGQLHRVVVHIVGTDADLTPKPEAQVLDNTTSNPYTLSSSETTTFPKQVQSSATHPGPADYLRNVAVTSFRTAVRLISDQALYYLLDAVEQRFPDPALSDEDVIECLGLCLEAHAFEPLRKILQTLHQTHPDLTVPANLLARCVEQIKQDPSRNDVVSNPIRIPQEAFMAVSMNIMTRQRAIIEELLSQP